MTGAATASPSPSGAAASTGSGSTTLRATTTGDGATAVGTWETTGASDERLARTVFHSDGSAAGAATSAIDPAGSAGPTACASGARNDGFCQALNPAENDDTGLISGCGATTRCSGGK
ncbi:hypothetical protein UK23_37990 [Lentzea aerocolonigenes]|uniref:Uncharacterized protein n=1 Tax=Lentzea aerocolonigenes TaxID=68170 RepID=A0A0F0GF84_LENAE|nr:hypothetical protein UK23_37990 [Lentzea aerocolonigenes]